MLIIIIMAIIIIITVIICDTNPRLVLYAPKKSECAENITKCIITDNYGYLQKTVLGKVQSDIQTL